MKKKKIVLNSNTKIPQIDLKEKKKLKNREVFLKKFILKRIKNPNMFINFKNTRFFFFNKKSYFTLKSKYKKFLSNRFNRKLIRRIIFYVQFKIINLIKKKKEKKKRIILLFYFDKVRDKMRKRMLFKNLSSSS